MKKRKIFFDINEINYNELGESMQIFKKETPRGAAIMGYSYLDNLLIELLTLRLVKDKDIFDRIDYLSLQQRIDLCYLTGIINRNEKEDLKIMKDIRNGFAHSITINSFDENDISKECKKLTLVESFHKVLPHLFPIDTPRDRFNSSISIYHWALGIRLGQCERIKERPLEGLTSQG